MNWNKLSLKLKADIIRLSVLNGVTDLSEIRQLYNSSLKGDGGLLDNIGDAVTTSARWVDRNIITPTSNILSAVSDPKGTAYAIMVGNNEDLRTLGSNRDINDIKLAINNRDSIVRNRGNIDRNLASLYIYGNDLGLFREAPELVPYGVEYNNYLRSIGRDPSKVKTYEGNFNAPTVVLPLGSLDRLRDYILSKNNKTFYVLQDPENTDFDTTDDVNNYTRRFSLNSKGEPIIVNSDLWDFEPNSYSTNNALPSERTNAWLKSKALDYIGNPFILKQVDPIEYTDIDTFYNMYDELPLESIEASRGMGYLPEFTFTSTRPTKKALGGLVQRKNRLGDGGITTAAKIEYLTNSYRKKDLLEPNNGLNDIYILPILSPQIAMFYSEKELDNLYNLYKNNPDIVYSHFQDNPLVGYAPLRLKTYYPITSEYPWTGHSELYLNNGSNQITTFGDTKGYNLVTNNCADSTRMALEAVFGEKLDYNLFTTPGDVRDFAIEHGGYYNKGKLDRGTTEVIIPMDETRYNNWKNYLRNPYTWWHDDNTPLPELEVYKYGGRINKFEVGGTIEPVDYETPWGITTRSRYRGVYTAPTSALYFKSKEDRDAYAALLDINLYGGELPELEVTAKGTPTQDILTEGLDKNVQLEEKPTTQRSPYADRFFNISDWDSLLGQDRVNINKRAWQRNPLYMLNWTDAGNAAAAFTVAPFATAAAGEYALPWLSLNIFPYLSARGWLAATQAVGNTPAWLTPTSAAFIDATLAGTATGASIYDMIENGPTFENVLGTTLGGISLAYEAYPTIMNGILAGRRAYNTFKLNRQLNKAASLFDGTVGADYFKSPSNWYRITESPEIMDLRYLGKNITTKDIYSYNSPSNDFRHFVFEHELSSGTGENEGYWLLPRKKAFLDFIKCGSAHGNTSLAAKGLIWRSTISSSGKFPSYIIEGEGPAKVFRGFNPATGADSRTHFVQVPWEEVPFGARIGFHTGEMPMEGLRAFRQLPNGRYLYEGPILPDKIIRVEESPLDNLNNILGGNINKFGEGGLKIEVRRSINGVTTPEVLGTFNNEDEYNNWLLNNSLYTEVPNNFITEATALLPELTVTANKDNTTSTNMGSYSNTKQNTNYSFRHWWNNIPSSLDRQWNEFLLYDPILGQRRIDNYRRAESMFPDLSLKYDVFNNAMETFNIAGSGVPNKISISQLWGFGRDLLNGKNALLSWYDFNSGIFTDKYASEHPAVTGTVNFIADLISPWAWSRLKNASSAAMNSYRFNKAINRAISNWDGIISPIQNKEITGYPLLHPSLSIPQLLRYDHPPRLFTNTYDPSGGLLWHIDDILYLLGRFNEERSRKIFDYLKNIDYLGRVDHPISRDFYRFTKPLEVRNFFLARPRFDLMDYANLYYRGQIYPRLLEFYPPLPNGKSVFDIPFYLDDWLTTLSTRYGTKMPIETPIPKDLMDPITMWRGKKYEVPLVNTISEVTDAGLFDDNMLYPSNLDNSYGLYVPTERTPYILNVGKSADLFNSGLRNFYSAAVHEAASHGTDFFVPQLAQKLYNYIARTLGFSDYLGGYNPVELRATVNEVRSTLPRKFKVNSNNVSQIPDTELINEFANTNGYGKYFINLARLKGFTDKEIASYIKYMIQYLPAAAPFYFINNSQEENKINKK